MKINAVFHFRVQVFQDDIIDIRSQVTDRSIQELEFVLDALFFEFRPRSGIKLCALSSVFQVNVIHILHQLDRFFLPDIFMERAAEIIRDIVLAVAESTRPAEA